MTVYFKLNNHQGGRHQVAYYEARAPLNHVDYDLTTWQHDPQEVIGQTCYVSTSRATINFINAQVGDYIVIAQRVHNQVRVMTHLVEITGEATTFQELFNDHPVVARFAEWPHVRACKIIALLDPRAFDFLCDDDMTDLSATREVDHPILLDTLTQNDGMIPNGYLHVTYGDRQEIDFSELTKEIKKNSHYLHML